MCKLGIIVSSAALALVGCSTPSDTTATSGPDDAVVIRTEVYAFTWIAQQVGGERVSVEQIIPTGADVHHYELSPKEVAELSETDLVVTSDGVATAVDDAVTEAQPANVIDATDYVDVLAADEHAHDEHADDEHADDEHADDEHADDEHADDEHADDEHADDEHADDEHADDEHGHDHGSFDPHTWLAIDQMPEVVTAVADTLSEIDPEGAETYAANAEAVNAELTSLDEQYRTGLATCERDTIVVTHPAFGYIANAYGFTQVGISGFDEDTEPSPARLAEVKDIAADTEATTIFLANTSNPKVADVLASELGLDTAVLDTVTGEVDGKDYLSSAEENLDALKAGLGCS
ncbi:MAG: metal ABC transporter solute-binding protein, Zn/Mn family [Arachnia sp.]